MSLTYAEREGVRRVGITAFLARPAAPAVTVDLLDTLLAQQVALAGATLHASAPSLHVVAACTNAIARALDVEYDAHTAGQIDTLAAMLREDIGAALYARLDPRAGAAP